MTYSIIGTGNIAWFLAKRLREAGHTCSGIYGRDKKAVELLAEEVLCVTYGAVTDIVDGGADVCFIAVADHAIPTVAAELSLKHTVLVHTAGSVSVQAIEHAAKDCAVLWPVYSILKADLPYHRNIPCAWEASSKKAERLVLSMGHAITDELFEAKSEQRKWLHLSAVISNNFINHLVTICEQICKENDLPFSTIYPIIEQTFDRIKHGSPYTLQTGPARRHDNNTIQDHLAILAQHPHRQRIYESITASIENMYGNKKGETDVNA